MRSRTEPQPWERESDTGLSWYVLAGAAGSLLAFGFILLVDGIPALSHLGWAEGRAVLLASVFLLGGAVALCSQLLARRRRKRGL